MATPTSKWDLANWTKGKVKFFDALGLKGATYPTLTPALSQSIAAGTPPAGGSNSTPSSSSGGSTNLSGNLSYAQLEQLWVDAGGNPAQKAIAAAIAEAESSGVQNATNQNSNGTIDRGYWQINSSHGTLSTFDPLGNARAAVSLSSNGANWQPWTTYNTGAYKKYLSGG